MPTNVISNILLVDDRAENHVALEALLVGSHRNIFSALSGEEALSLMLVHEFALALVDVHMPGMSGFELAELMRSTERTRQVAIIFVSAAPQNSSYDFAGYQLGAIDFLHKPLDPVAVRSKVNLLIDLYASRRALQREVHRQHSLLEQLEHTRRELEEAVNLRDGFMSMVSHELRNPLNTLLLEAKLRESALKRGQLERFSPEKLSEMVVRDRRNVKNIVRLIDDMLDVTRLRSGQFTLKLLPCDLSALAERVVAEIRQHDDAQDVELTLECPQPVVGVWDEFRLEQVLTNLLTNALRYGGKQPVKVTVDVHDGMARLQVADQGPGIALAEQTSIFQQYKRGNSEQRHNVGGLGLGLFITREIARNHGGDIQLVSEVGRGSTFVVTLPCANAHS